MIEGLASAGSRGWMWSRCAPAAAHAAASPASSSTDTGTGGGFEQHPQNAHTVVEKAWEQIVSIGRRTFWEPNTVLVTGAGPIGLLAALIAAESGTKVHVLDRATSGPKPDAVEALGAAYHTGAIDDIGISPDIVIECTGVAPLIRQAAEAVAPGAIVCLTGVGPPIVPDASAPTNLPTDVVLKNLVLFGTVNANRRH
jgi:threonine dehydrogenase-like Zn-dependent dehydrogenase